MFMLQQTGYQGAAAHVNSSMRPGKCGKQTQTSTLVEKSDQMTYVLAMLHASLHDGMSPAVQHIQMTMLTVCMHVRS